MATLPLQLGRMVAIASTRLNLGWRHAGSGPDGAVRLADRVNSVEGVVQDLGKGRMSNPLVEMGMVPQSRTHEAALGTAAVAGLAVTALVMELCRR